MKIGYDGKRAVKNNTGLGNYSRLAIESVGKTFPNDTLIVYTPELRDNTRLSPIRNLRNVEWRLPQQTEIHFGKSLWRSLSLGRSLKADNIDIYHGLSNELPLDIKRSDIPSVLTLHDVIYRRLPYCYKAIDRWIYDYKYGHSCRLADKIIAISECTRRDVIEFYGVPEDRVEVIYQGCDEIFKKTVTHEEVTEIRKRYKLPERYILQVGSIERRKNAELTVKGLRGIDKDVRLVLAGRRTPYVKKILKTAIDNGVDDRVLIVDNVGFNDLPAVYKGAECAVYPSRYEGFGLPVLEAVTCGVPVIAATGSCLEEAGGKSCIYVDPDDSTAMSDALRAVTRREIDIDKNITEGLKHAAQFSNVNIATRLHDIYKKLL